MHPDNLPPGVPPEPSASPHSRGNAAPAGSLAATDGSVPAPLGLRHGSLTSQRVTVRSLTEGAIQFGLGMCALLTVCTTVAIIWVLGSEAFGFFERASLWNFFTDVNWTPNLEESGDQVEVGIRSLLIGTLLVCGIACVVGLPVGLASAIYLSEYASPRFRSIVKPTLEMLSGIPTVVYGYFALRIVNPAIIQPFATYFHDALMWALPRSWEAPVHSWLGSTAQSSNAAAGGIAVGIMIVPLVTSLSEDVLRSVPRGLREAAYALGANKFEVCVKVVLPAAMSGVLAAFLLAFSRAIGETMAVSIAAGEQVSSSLNPFRATSTMTAYIASVSRGEAAAGTLTYYSIYAVGATLFLITLLTNMASQWILRRYREVYQ